MSAGKNAPVQPRTDPPGAERLAAAKAFLTGSPWARAEVTPLAGDASNRRYFRVLTPDHPRAVLMDAPPARGETVGPFIEMTRRLRTLGLSAPGILLQDTSEGFLLLEDLGDDLFARVLKTNPARERELYGAAIDVLVALQDSPHAATDLPAYDMPFYVFEGHLMLEWYLRPFARGADADAFGALLQEALTRLTPAPPVCVLRDYHAENLLWLPGRAGLARVGLLDYQDARAGHHGYDLASLLEDARRDLDPATPPAMVRRYLDATGRRAADLEQDLAILALQRNLKIMGVFARLWLRDGKPQYLDLLPRVWAHIEADLTHPSLASLAGWIDRNVPAPDASVRARLMDAR